VEGDFDTREQAGYWTVRKLHSVYSFYQYSCGYFLLPLQSVKLFLSQSTSFCLFLLILLLHKGCKDK